jgi:hypothetical protein
MDYKNAKALGQPLGSGAVESTCSQYQRRFKRTGQFWSLEGDEAFLALSGVRGQGGTFCGRARQSVESGAGIGRLWPGDGVGVRGIAWRSGKPATR